MHDDHRIPYRPGLRRRLTPRDEKHFVGETLFARLARAVCQAECLPRKELFEAWEVARRTRRFFRGGRVVDLAAGHGLLAWTLLILDDTSPGAVCVDRRCPPSAGRLEATLAERWPRLAGRIKYVQGPIESVPLETGDLAVSCHACGGLTDQVLDLAVAARARVVVLPCCQNIAGSETGHLEGWLDGALAVDVTRAMRLRAAGYRIRTQRIPEEITPKNRLLMGAPES